MGSKIAKWEADRKATMLAILAMAKAKWEEANAKDPASGESAAWDAVWEFCALEVDAMGGE